MLNYKLEQVAEKLDETQQRALRQLQKKALLTNSAFEKYQAGDMSHVLELDVACREELHGLQDMISRIEITDILYSAFLSDTAQILDALDGCVIPPHFTAEYDAARLASEARIRLNPQEIFTVISVMITAVALCLSQLEPEVQRAVIKKLDVLLEIKEKQLTLMKDLKRWQGDFLRPDGAL